MLVKVLKNFPYSPSGSDVVNLVEGQVLRLREDVLDGLYAEGYIGEVTDDEASAAMAGDEVVRPPVEIPQNWAELAWFDLRSIAKALSNGQAPANKAAALAIIADEMTKRGG